MNQEPDGKQAAKKTKTTKSRRETAVQGTNDSSIVSKCSMAALGYFEDVYLQNFVLKLTRRAPLIHRGYYIRAKTIDFILKNFLEKNEGPKQIISLGAGFDSAYFRLKSKGLLSDTVFYEVDFPEVVKRKHALIRNNPELLEMVGERCSEISLQSPLIELSTKTYSLLGVDLSQTNTVEAALKLCDLDIDTPTLLLSECVLTYMTRRCASAVVRWAAETFYNSMFVLYEQINPDDAFGLFMQQHFNTVGSPLKSINYFPTIQSQKDRFLKLGWSQVEALDMNQFYFGLLAPGERDRVEGLEPFDECEEWHLKCAHYMVLCGYRGNCPTLLTSPGLNTAEAKLDVKAFDDMIRIPTPSKTPPLRRFGHGTCVIADSLAVSVGGFGEQKGKHMRVTEVTFTDLVTMETQFVNMSVDNKVVEVSRMHATVHCLSDGRVILIGGRLSPMRLCTQIVAMQMHYGQEKLPVDGRVHWGKEEVTKKEKEESVCVENMNCGNQMNCGESKKINRNENEVGCVNKSDVCTNISNGSKANNCDVISNSQENMNCGVNDALGMNCSPEGIVELVAEFGASSVCDSGSGETAGALAGCHGDRRASARGVQGMLCTELKQVGELPCPRWRHSAVLCQKNGEDQLVVFGGRTQTVQALGDCYTYTPASAYWNKVVSQGASPVARQSHTASLWNNHMVVAGGLSGGLQPLDSVHLLNLDTQAWTQLQCSIRPRYSHTAHVMEDCLVLIGGVSLSHSTPGVAVVHLPSGHSAEFSLPRAEKGRLLMMHSHTSVVLDCSRVMVLGGGGNCFSFGTQLNATPVILDLGEALTRFKAQL